MANESFSQGLIASLLNPAQGQNDAQMLMGAVNSANPMASYMASQVNQTSNNIGQNIRGMLGGIRGEPVLSGTEALQQGLAKIDMSSSEGLMKAAQLAQKTGRTAEAVQLMQAASVRQREEEQEAMQKRKDEAQLAYQSALQKQTKNNITIANLQEERAGVQAERDLEADEWNQQYREGQLEFQKAQLKQSNADSAAAAQAREIAGLQLSTAEQAQYSKLDEEVSAQLLLAGAASSVANRYALKAPTSGVAGRSWEKIKGMFGTEDDITRLRDDFLSLRAQYTLANLPAGPASDKDIAFAMEGWPDETYNAKMVASFMRGQAKAAALVALLQPVPQV